MRQSKLNFTPTHSESFGTDRSVSRAILGWENLPNCILYIEKDSYSSIHKQKDIC